jgi:hypothetical protein
MNGRAVDRAVTIVEVEIARWRSSRWRSSRDYRPASEWRGVERRVSNRRTGDRRTGDRRLTNFGQAILLASLSLALSPSDRATTHPHQQQSIFPLDSGAAAGSGGCHAG